MLKIRLRLLLFSFNQAAADYSLARLEVAGLNARVPSPPVLGRLGPFRKLEEGFAQAWPGVLERVNAIGEYCDAVERGELDIKIDTAWTRFAHCSKMLAQFASGIEWVRQAPGKERRGDGLL